MSIQQNFNQQPEAVSVSGLGKFFYYIICIFTLGIYPVCCGNNIKKMDQKVNEADSGIDVQLKKRRDMLTKMVDTVKQSMKFEQTVLEQVTKLRSLNFDSMSMEDKSKALSTMQDLQGKINLQMEAYPQLMNGPVISQLNQGISDCEDDIEAARRIYNSNASIFNQYVVQWPADGKASGMHCETKPFFSATEQDKKDVDIDLGFKD